MTKIEAILESPTGVAYLKDLDGVLVYNGTKYAIFDGVKLTRVQSPTTLDMDWLPVYNPKIADMLGRLGINAPIFM